MISRTLSTMLSTKVSDMVATSDVKVPQMSLQSQGHEDLLNVIDELRAQGISRFIDLPQLIVCGDQSSGKSSVLEAISGVRFPTKDSLCTRFATELILRRNHEEHCSVTIVPADDRGDNEKAKLAAFKTNTATIEDLGDLIEAAEECMGLGDSGHEFSLDCLRVEISGPNQPHLTLVDLPGVFHSGTAEQSEADAEIVRTLVRSYMKTKRSIILAVVSAKNDLANQIVTSLSREYDPNGERTLGIITKPDLLDIGSGMEQKFVDLACNKDVTFRLGWHVLQNRSFKTKDATMRERDINEKTFFEQGIWKSVPPNLLGINALRPRLSRVLQDQILTELPGLLRDVESGIDECQSRLTRLGGSRATFREQQKYLLNISRAFESLVKAAVNGPYIDPFFGEGTDKEDFAKRLRAVCQDDMNKFTREINRKGQAERIVNEAPVTGDLRPGQILRTDYLTKVKEQIRINRCTELPGIFNPSIVEILFHRQSRPWAKIVDKWVLNIMHSAQSAIISVLNHVADAKLVEGLLQNVINPALDDCKTKLQLKSQEILVQHTVGHPMTWNHYFTENIQKAQADEWTKMVTKKLDSAFGPYANTSLTKAAVLQAMTTPTQQDMDTYACNGAVNAMQAYYKV